MKLKFKEDPKEWRKSALLTLLGLVILSSLLRWRKHLPQQIWLALLIFFGALAIFAWLQPRWFRGWYRLSLRLGFYSSQFIGRCALILIFIFIVTPLGLIFRCAGKDALRLKRRQNVASYWRDANASGPLDRLF